MAARLPKLPLLLGKKIYKSGQTRGADDDEIYQNRVSRNGTALIGLDMWRELLDSCPQAPGDFFENGYIVLISPCDYFSCENPDLELKAMGLRLGQNSLVFYQRRADWDEHNPMELGWSAASSRTAPLGGEYVARVHATTAIENGERVVHGFTTTEMKGAGIRFYEYAPIRTIQDCRLQLEAVYWLCENSEEAAIRFGMTAEDAAKRKEAVLGEASQSGLLDASRLKRARIINDQGIAICPLCLESLDAGGFYSKKAQARGREKFDLTITEVNLFHIEELRPGVFNHRPYNLGWGHHLCNVVVGDAGIDSTVQWMKGVVERNMEYYATMF